MPPRAKYTREEITQAALSVVRASGIDSLTARSLGDCLGSSARPIFTVFQNMEEVQKAVVDAAKEVYKTYIEKGLASTPAFKGVGTQYITFAMQEPKLFQLLFMREQSNVYKLQNILPMIDDNYAAILYSVQNAYDMDTQTAENLYKHMWIYTHGIATLCVTKLCKFTTEEISLLMTQVFAALLKNTKESGRNA